MSDRCTGHCCRAFSLPYSLEGMKIGYKKAIAQLANGDYLDEDRKRILQDHVRVYPMLIPLNGGRPGHHPDGPARQGGQRYYYTCRHYKNGQCTNYERRPNMCRDYPAYRSKQLCEYRDCTWDGHHGLRAAKLRVFREAPCSTKHPLTKISGEQAKPAPPPPGQLQGQSTSG